MDRKKELKRQYLQMKPTMGVFTISNMATGEVYLEATKDLKSRMNSTPCKLNAGSHPSRPLQIQWREYGEDNFKMEVLDTLDYDKDDEKRDYSDDLEVLRTIWEERLIREGKSMMK